LVVRNVNDDIADGEPRVALFGTQIWVSRTANVQPLHTKSLFNAPTNYLRNWPTRSARKRSVWFKQVRVLFQFRSCGNRKFFNAQE